MDGCTFHTYHLSLCAEQLAAVFTMIFNLSLTHSVIPTCFNTSTIIPMPKKTRPACLNDYCQGALTSVVMKCFEQLIKDYICSSLPRTLHYYYHYSLPIILTDQRKTQWSTFFTPISHMNKKGSYVRLLFIDYSLSFNSCTHITV